ncbi:trypsin-like peptidase domain-containing protein [Neobacillus sp. MM2021_6]|uniref:S1C family serine protease n=1 Tax=Bacillaceae TaxID=186817 RepID=UPI00140B1F26|nr:MULTISPECIES: trypsin-like peptidase domain-containing protein [Bacillaceae]MBO0962045.1 trypsin-like peptidase domain-containing protein [Neobacillus sp. MM2021_6]NHC19952.1 PDZ domain-containing protein [Bacillus sp. MM2020_4]
MEFKNDHEFEQNQPDSVENTETTNRNQDYSQMEENSTAVDATFMARSTESEEIEERVETEEVVVAPPVNEKTRLSTQPETKKWKGRGFVSTLAAGVIGSVLTLAVLPHTDYMKNFNQNTENQVTSNSAAPVKQVSAQPTMASSNSIADTVEKISKAIVGVVNFRQQQNNDPWGNSSASQSVESGSGSGVIFQKSGSIAYIVTNNHVVEGASKLEISLFDGQKTTAEVVGTDALTDLAVLKIDAKYVTATADFGDSSTLRPGDQVYAIGNPLGLNLSRTVTQGIVSAVDRSIAVSTSAGNWDTNVIQTDAAINPGNSGGALINPQGQVIGINSLKISESGVEGLGFAIPSNDFIPIVNQLIKSGKVDRPYLGVGLADLDQVPQMYWQNMPENVKKGVLVMNIDPNSAAAKAGFEPKDVIVSMNGTEIANSAELRKFLYTKVKTGDTIKFDVYRDGKQVTLTAKLTNNKGA